MNENDFTHKIEDIKRRLYSPDEKSVRRQREGILHSIPHKVSDSWQKTQEKVSAVTKIKPRKTFFKRFFLIAVIFFVCAIAFAGYKYFSGVGKVSNDNIEINMLGNAFVQGGEDLPVQVEIVNRNNASLELANLIIEYPSGASDDPSNVIRLPRESLGTIPAGGQVEKNEKVVLYGDQGSVRNVKVRLEYHPQGSNAIFTTEKLYPVTISSAPISLVVDGPITTSSDQDIILNVTTSLNTTLPSSKTMLKVDYPSGFIFGSANPAPTGGNSLWDLSAITKTTPFKVVIRGRLTGENGDQQSFHFYVGTSNNNDTSLVNIVYNSLLHTVDITKPFLEAKIFVDDENSDTHAVSGGDLVHGYIYWSNNLPSRISDVQIIAHFSGNAFDRNNIDSDQGFFDSANNQIIWDKNSDDNLGSIEPGVSGKVSFSFKPLSLIGAGKEMSSPQIAIDVSIKGQEPQEGSTFADINSVDKTIVKVLSDFQLATSAIFTSGALPPKVEKETRYTITWTLSNSANTIINAEARATLPIWVNWVGLAPGVSEGITYNQTTREIVWKIGSVQANTGFGSTNREASFIISLSPSSSQAGSIPQLVKEVNLIGQDSFSGSQVKSVTSAISTNTPNDPSFQEGDEKVIQ